MIICDEKENEVSTNNDNIIVIAHVTDSSLMIVKPNL